MAIKSQDKAWFYPREEIGGGVCEWCDDRGVIIKFTTSQGHTVKICQDCVQAGRRLSTGGFVLNLKLIPAIVQWRKKKILETAKI